MKIGDEWIYRLNTFSPYERVRILDIEKRKQTTRVDIEFLDGENAGRKQNVPGGRLQGRWSGVGEYDERMANWQRIGSVELDETEDWAVMEVFDLLVPDDVATHYDSFVKNGTTVRDVEALENLMKRPISDVLEQVEWFQDGDVLHPPRRAHCSSPSTRVLRTQPQYSNASWLRRPNSARTASGAVTTMRSMAPG